MSALGQKQTFWPFIAMSALPPKADIGSTFQDVRFVPKADIATFHGAPWKVMIKQPIGTWLGPPN
jgi:hypothetical protein